jgi:hypothetical protein
VPRAVLLDLAAALRLLGWEQDGVPLPRSAGLPSALEALREVFRALADPPPSTPAPPRRPLISRVLAAFVDHFAWGGRRDLDADVLLGEAEDLAALEDELVGALAEFLWAHRKAKPAGMGGVDDEPAQ